MALKLDEKVRAGTARLEVIIASLYASMKANDIREFQAQRDILQAFIQDGTVPSPVRQVANDAMLKLGKNITNAGINDMSEEADRMAAAGAGLTTANAVLEAGKAELFFPALASASKCLAELCKTLKEAADKIGADITNVDGLHDLPDLIKDVSEEGEGIMKKLKRAGKA